MAFKAEQVGKNIRDSEDHLLSDKDLVNFIDTLIKLLGNPNCLSATADGAVQKLNQLKTNTLVICENDITEALKHYNAATFDDQQRLILQAIRVHFNKVKAVSVAEIDIIVQFGVTFTAQNITKNISTSTFSISEIEEMGEKDLQNSLIDNYRKQNYSKFPNLGHNVQLIKVYVQPQHHELGKNKLSSYKKLVWGNQSQNRNIYVIGNAGMGMTALCKHFVMTWSQAHSPQEENSNKFGYEDIEAMNRFDMLFLIRVHDLKNYSDVEDIIYRYISQVLHTRHINSKQCVRHLLERRTCLVILDGLDEWTHSSFCAPKHVSCTVLTTTLPWKFSHQFTVQGLRQLQICDQSRKQSHTLFTNVLLLKRYTQFYDINDFNNWIAANHLQQYQLNPCVVIQLVNLWVNRRSGGISKCEIYSTIVESSINHEIRRLVLDNILHLDRIDFVPHCMQNKHFCRRKFPILLKLGELALESAIDDFADINTDLMCSIFTESVQHFLFETGFLCKTLRLARQQFTMSSNYKSLQLFFAALYMRSLWMNQGKKEVIRKASQLFGVSLDKFTVIFSLLKEMDSDTFSEIQKAFASFDKGHGKSIEMEPRIRTSPIRESITVRLTSNTFKDANSAFHNGDSRDLGLDEELHSCENSHNKTESLPCLQERNTCPDTNAMSEFNKMKQDIKDLQNDIKELKKRLSDCFFKTIANREERNLGPVYLRDTTGNGLQEDDNLYTDLRNEFVSYSRRLAPGEQSLSINHSDDTNLNTIPKTLLHRGIRKASSVSRGRCRVFDPLRQILKHSSRNRIMFSCDEIEEETLENLKLPDPGLFLSDETWIKIQDKNTNEKEEVEDKRLIHSEQTLSSGYPISTDSLSKETFSSRSVLLSVENNDAQTGLEKTISETSAEGFVQKVHNRCSRGVFVNSDKQEATNMNLELDIKDKTEERLHRENTTYDKEGKCKLDQITNIEKEVTHENKNADNSTETNIFISENQNEYAKQENLKEEEKGDIVPRDQTYTDNVVHRKLSVFDSDKDKTEENCKHAELSLEKTGSIRTKELSTYQSEMSNDSNQNIEAYIESRFGSLDSGIDSPLLLDDTKWTFLATAAKNKHVIGCLLEQSHVEVFMVCDDGIVRQVNPLEEFDADKNALAESKIVFPEAESEVSYEPVTNNDVTADILSNKGNEQAVLVAFDEVKETGLSVSNTMISPINRIDDENITEGTFRNFHHAYQRQRKSVNKLTHKSRFPVPRPIYRQHISPHSSSNFANPTRRTSFRRKRRLSSSPSYTGAKTEANSSKYDSGLGSSFQSILCFDSDILTEKDHIVPSCELFEEYLELIKHILHVKEKTFKRQRSKNGLKIKVCKLKPDNSQNKYKKQIKRFVNDKFKTFINELHVGNRKIPVFGLWSYFDKLNRGETLSDRERMQYEWLRLASFQNYTGNGNSLYLARNGFYHDHNDGPTATRCYLCEFRHSTWEYFDDIEAQHRRQSPDCPFHTNRSEESTNVSISYENYLQPPRSPRTSNGSLNSTNSLSAMRTVSGISNPSVLTSSNDRLVTSTDTTSVTGSLASAVKEAIRGISQAQIGSQNMESLVYQPQENDDNREHSLLALPNSQSFRVLGRSGETAYYSHLTTPPRRNNIAAGAASNASLDASPSNIPTSTASSTASTLFRPSSLPGGPERAGVFRGPNASDTALISKAASRSTTFTTQSSAAALAAAGSLLRPPQPQGGGGRTDPTITVVVNNPKHPDYRELDARINSYQGWPDYLDQTPRQMSEAGFFFVGVADFTRCFCCGGGLRNWEPGDDPMLEHTRWFPRCEYVNKLKGERYVAAVQRRHREHMAAQQREQLELAQQRDTNRNPPDPMTTEAAAVLREMGYQTERIRDAILAVRRQIGVPDVTTQQVLAWLLDQHEGRSSPTSSRSSPTRDLGVKVSSASIAVGGGSQQSSSSTTTTHTESKSTEGKITDQTNSKVNETKECKTLEKHSAATGGDSNEEFKSAEETLSAEPKSTETKATEKNKSKSSNSSKRPDIDTKTLKEENEKLREMQTCKICMERLVNTTLLPCGHLVCCDICASRLNRCPICRKRINGTVKTFMS